MRAMVFGAAICAAFVLSGVTGAVPPPPFEWHTFASAPRSGILAGAKGSKINLWDPQTGKVMRTLTGHAASVTFLAFSPDGKMLTSCDRDLTMHLWDAQTGKVKRTLSKPEHPGWLVGFTQDGHKLITTGRDGTVESWDVETGKLQKSFQAQEDVLSAALSPDGNTLATVSGKFPFQQVRLWDVGTGKAGRVLHFGDYNGWYNWLTFSPDGKSLAAVGDCAVGEDRVSGSVLTLWDVGSGKSQWTRERGGGTPCGVTFAPDGKTLATGGGYCVEFWDAQTGKRQGSMETKGLINSVVISRDGKNLVVADWKSLERGWAFQVAVYEVKVMKTGTPVRHLED